MLSDLFKELFSVGDKILGLSFSFSSSTALPDSKRWRIFLKSKCKLSRGSSGFELSKRQKRKN